MSGSTAVSEAPTNEPDASDWEAGRRELERRLLEELRAAFPQAQPNYARPLDGRVVDTRFDPETGQLRNVTDYEMAGAVTSGLHPEFVADRIAYGKRIRQVWSWAMSGVQFHYNEWWATKSHYGYQHRSICGGCGEEIWTNCDRPAPARCRVCRWTSGACAETGLACATAYKNHDCRCDDCRRWNADRMRRVRSKRTEPQTGSRNTVLSKSSLDTGTLKDSGIQRTSTSTKNGVTRTPEPATWTWLPVEMRAHIARHKAVVDAYHAERAAAKDTARRRCFCKSCKQRGFLREELSATWLCIQCDPKRVGLVKGSVEYFDSIQLNIATD